MSFVGMGESVAMWVVVLGGCTCERIVTSFQLKPLQMDDMRCGDDAERGRARRDEGEKAGSLTVDIFTISPALPFHTTRSFSFHLPPKEIETKAPRQQVHHVRSPHGTAAPNPPSHPLRIAVPFSTHQHNHRPKCRSTTITTAKPLSKISTKSPSPILNLNRSCHRHIGIFGNIGSNHHHMRRTRSSGRNGRFPRWHCRSSRYDRCRV